jgi:hypothetical protein
MATHIMFDSAGFAVGFMDAHGVARNTKGYRCSPSCRHGIACTSATVGELGAELDALRQPCEGCNAMPGESCREWCLSREGSA